MTLDLKKPQTMKVRPVCLNTDIALKIITILGSTQFTLYQLQLLDKAQTTDAIEFKSHFLSLFRMKICC